MDLFERMENVYLGYTVNLAVRLEEPTKSTGKPILFDENTWQGLSDAIEVEDQGLVQFKEKRQAGNIFAVPVKQRG